MDGQSGEHNLYEIISAFEIDGTYVRGYRYGNGHINDTYCIETSGQDISKYILQRLNGNVFKKPEKLMENVLRVTSHIREKLAIKGRDSER
ncbi:MAG: mucin desulfatase, partial [Spirochaetales bacterium]|nr:mucin desulfatase [Spirochaetales bacterium]